MSRLVVIQELRLAEARTETFMGREFRVIPAVLVRSQVLHNNIGRTFLPAEYITDEWADGWNNMPVLVGPHPTADGVAASGRDPVLINERGVGWIFHAKAEQETARVRRLVGEVWIDLARAEAVNGLQAVLDQLDAGSPVELSTGFAALAESRGGVFEGEAYNIVMRPGFPDHLVISTEMTGACSVGHGCGLGVNEGKQDPSQERTVEPPKKGLIQTVMARLSEMFPKDEAPKTEWSWTENAARQVARELDALNAVTPSDQERANLLRGALQAQFGGTDREVVVTDVFSDEKCVVFWLSSPMGPMPPGPEYYRVEFTEGEGGAFTFGEYEKVRRMTAYEPVAQSANAANTNHGKPCGCQGDSMNQQEKEALTTELTASVMAAVNAALKPVTDGIAKISEQATAAANAAVAPVKTGLEAALNTLTEEVKALAKTVNATRDAERQALVQALSANEKTGFTAADLEAMPLENLRKLAVLAKIEVPSFVGRPAPAQNSNSEPEGETFAPPVPYHVKPAATAPATGGK